MLIDKEDSKARALPNKNFFSTPKEGLKLQFYPAAIEFGSNSIRLAQLAKVSEGYGIAKIDYLSLPDKTNSQIDIKNYLGDLISASKIKGRVVSSLPLGKVQIFTYALPNMPEGEIEQAAAWKLKQNLPSGLSFQDVSFDYIWRAHSANDTSGEIHIIIFVIPKDIAMERIKFFRDYSLDLVSLEPVPYAIFSFLLGQGKIRQEETVLILDIGASESSITIVHSGYPYMIRPLAISGNILTEAIANYNQFDLAHAEEVKIKQGLNNIGGESVCLPAVSSQLESLVVDVEHTFKSFSHQLMKSRVNSFERIILTGSTARLKNIDVYLKEKLGAPIEIFNPLETLKVVPGYQLGPSVIENANSFASTLGLAARFI